MTSPPEREPKPSSISPPDSTALRLLDRAELPCETTQLARYLIGTILVSDAADGRAAMRIVETEAYLPGDAAAHSFRGETERNRSLFLGVGHAYVYFIYGMYYCVNVTSETLGVGAGVLVRAGEPIVGLDLMRRRHPSARTADLGRGPGRLAMALGIGRDHDGLDLTAGGSLWLAAPSRRAGSIVASPRIGITKAADRILRYFERGSPFASGTKRQNAEPS
ncbi:MAG: DNA-3-methyladenine glycosylase [Vulcanimicrobiaceae bacterium]